MEGLKQEGTSREDCIDAAGATRRAISNSDGIRRCSLLGNLGGIVAYSEGMD